MMRFLGRRGTTAILHFDYTAEDSSSSYTIYNVAYSAGGDTTIATQLVCSCATDDTTSLASIADLPFTNARTFDGVASKASIQACNTASWAGGSPHVLDVEKPSIEAWIKPVSFTGSTQVIAGYYPSSAIGGYKLYLDASGNLRFATRDGGGTEYTQAWGMADRTPGQWYYVAVTYDGINARFYINGDLVKTGSLLTGTISYGAQLTTDYGMIGYNNDGDTDYFAGSIASIRFSYEPVPPWEIYRIYNSDSDPSTELSVSDNAVLVYNLNDDTDPQNTDELIDDAENANAVVTNNFAAGIDDYTSPYGGTTLTTRVGLRLGSSPGAGISVPAASIATSTLNDRTKDMTIEMLFSPDNQNYTTTDQYLLGKRDVASGGYPLDLFTNDSDSGYLTARIKDSTVPTVLSIAVDYSPMSDRPNYLVMTWDASEKLLSLWLDGIFLGSGTNANLNTSTCGNAEDFQIGCTKWTGHGDFPVFFANSQIHAVRVSEYVMTPIEIQTLFNGFTPTEDNG